MNSHWFVIASQNTIKIFADESDKNKIRLIKSLTNPLGRVRNREMVRKNSGTGITAAGGRNSLYYSITKRHDPHDESAKAFARELVHYLDGEFEEHHYENLTIVAEPHFLGKIRSSLNSKLLKHVTTWIGKDLEKTPQSELPKHLFPKNKSVRIASEPTELIK